MSRLASLQPQLSADDLSFIPLLVDNLPPENAARKLLLDSRIQTAVRRALRHQSIHSNSQLYPPFSIALCAFSSFSGVQLHKVHHEYTLQCNVIPIQFSKLQRINAQAWTPIYSELRLAPSLSKQASTEKSQPEMPKQVDASTPKNAPNTPNESDVITRTPKTPKSNAYIFSNTHILLVPSPFFSRTSAQTISIRAKEKGATTQILSPGATGISEACSLTNLPADRTEQPQHKSRDDENNRVIVIADAALTKRRLKQAIQLDCVVPPKWLTDSLRASRFKPTHLYSVTPTKPKQSPSTHPQHVQPSSPPKSETPSRGKRKLNRTKTEQLDPVTDFRAEHNLHSDMLNNVKRRKIDNDYKENEFLGKGTPFTVATRLFTTPKKKSIAKDHDHDLNGGGVNIVKKEEQNVGGGRWACEIRTGGTQSEFPSNDHICELLSIVQQSYEAKKDSFRSLGYQKALARLKAIDYEILCMEDVRRLQEEANIGIRMIDKIGEVVKTGRLLQAEAVLQDSDYNAIKCLCGVWGIGPVRAFQIRCLGIKSVEQLRAAVRDNIVSLDRCQRIGLNRYEDLLQKMPRSYVSELEMYVKKVAKSIDTVINVTVAGSYLRGKSHCGDADILIHGEYKRVCAALPKIRVVMKRDGVLTDDLVSGGAKYFGVFRLPGRPHGRIDLFAVPKEEFPFALLTYTGSAVFNRSMRAKARALGYSLSHRTMQRVIRTKNEKRRTEAPIVVKDEREIFDMLDIPYVTPKLRSIK